MVVAAGETQPGSGGHGISIDTPPIERISSLRGELPQEFALCAAIAFTKGMDGVDFAEVPATPAGEGFSVEVLEEVLAWEFFEDAAESHFNELCGAEEVATFGDVDGAELAGPIVDILKQGLVDRLNMEIVESSLGWILAQFKISGV